MYTCICMARVCICFESGGRWLRKQLGGLTHMMHMHVVSMYQLTGHWIRNRLVCSNLTVVE